MNSFALLGLPSVVVFVLLVVYLFRNLGARLTLFYFGGAFAYGILRRYVLGSLIHDDFGPLFPYLMNSPALKVGAVSVQEIMGWSIAALLSWLLSDRLLQRFRIEPAPHRIALLSFFCMGALCLAVETAAIGAGWWIWTIKQPSHPIFGRVPLIGLLDWGFVAFDFLLPFLLFAAPAPLASRLISLTLFPLHFFFHSKSTILPEPVPVTPNDLMHAAIFGYVLSRGIDEKSSILLPSGVGEKCRWFPFWSLLIIVLSTILADSVVAKKTETALASLPLLILSLLAFLPLFSRRKQESKNRVKKKSEWQVLYRFGAFVLIFCIMYWLRAPFSRKTLEFVESIKSGVSQWNAGNLKKAENQFRRAVQIRPDQPSGHAILGQLLFQKQKSAEARKELEEALALNPTQRDALILLTTMDLREKRWKKARERARYGNEIYPDSPEFLYQQGIAERNLGEERTSAQSIEKAIDLARAQGPRSRQILAALATSLRDTSTTQALRLR